MQLTADGTWLEVHCSTRPIAPRPALFLDRDGVVVEEVGYLSRVQDLRLIAGAAATIAAANRAGWRVVLVTNQSGIGRGYYGWAEFAALQAALHERLAADGAGIDMTLACPHHADGTGVHRHPDHPWRKPRPGMLIAARDALGLDCARSWIIGDNASDIAAGRAAGLAGGLHVLTGHGPRYREDALALANGAFAVIPIASIADAARPLALGEA